MGDQDGQRSPHTTTSEFNVADIGKSKQFYGDAFGWTVADYGPDYCEFRDDKLAAGLHDARRGPLEVRPARESLYADDLPATVKRVEAAGGTIVRPIYNFPGGQRFHFADPDGYELAVYTEVAMT